MAAANVAVFLSADDTKLRSAFDRSTKTIQQFEKTFGSSANSLEAHKRRIDAAFSSLSGDNLLKDANAMAAAVTKIGGAAKLTEAEQRRVNAAVTEAIAKYKALGQSAPASLLALQTATQQIATATKNIEAPVTGASKAMGLLSNAFVGFTAANLAASAIATVIGKLSEFAAQGAKLPGLQASFKNLTASIGQDSSKMLATLQSSTRGLVSNIDLMQSSNKAILLGLPVTSNEMGELAKAATVLGKAMGQDATKSLDDLITALGRSSPLILDNLGLTVKVGEANEAYAEKLGKNVNALTDAEKKMAFYNAAMEAARAKTKELGDQTLTLGEIVSVAWVKIGNVVTATAGTINVGVGRALSSGREFALFASDVVKFGIGVATLNADLRNQIEAAGNTKAPLTPAQLAFDEAFKQKAALQELERAAISAGAALAPLTSKQRDLAVAFLNGGESASEVATRLNAVTATAGVTDRQIKALEDSMKGGAKSSSAYEQSIKGLVDQLGGANLGGEVKKLQEAWNRLTPVQRANADVMDRTAEAADKLRQQGARLTPELFQMTVQSGLFSDSIGKISEGVPAAALKLSQLGNVFKESATYVADYLTAINQTMPALAKLSRLPGETLFAPKISDAQERILEDAARWEGVGRNIGSSIASGIGSDVGVFQSVGRVLGEELGREAGEAASKWIASQISGSLGKVLGGIAGALLPGIGALLGDLGGKLLDSLFDRNKGRDLVKDFAQSMGGFDALRAELNRLPEGGEKLWIALTQGVGRNNPEQAKAAIEAINDALANIPASMSELASGAGFKTLDELKAIAAESVKLAKFMEESGKYSAAAVQQAWERANQALADSGDQAVIAAQQASDAIKKLEGELQSFAASLQAEQDAPEYNEAGERIFGVIEAQQMARKAAIEAEMAAIEEQRIAAQNAIKDTATTAGQSATDAANEIQKVFSATDFVAKLRFEYDLPNGVSIGGKIPAMASGGVVRRPTLALIGEAGPEAVVPLSKYHSGMDPSAGAMSTVILEQDGRQVAEIVVPHIPGVVRRYGLA